MSGLAARWMIFGEWRAHPARVIMAALAIATGVALGFAIHLINASALSEFAQAVRTVNGDADLQVRAVTPFGFDEMLYPKLARIDGVAGASPVVELAATISGATKPVTLIGLDVFRAAGITPRLLGQVATSPPAPNADPSRGRAGAAADASAAFGETSIFLSDAALAATGSRVGEAIQLTAAGRTASFTIGGMLPAVEDQAIAVVDIASAQWRFAQLGRLQRIDLLVAEGANAGRVEEAVARILPPSASISSTETQARQSDNLSRAYRVNLDMLALVALLTGAFLVYSAQSLSVARRRPQFALLRVLGTTRRALLAQILIEGSALGVVGAALGLGLGLGLADAALRVLGGDLGGGYFSGTRPDLVFAPWAALTFLMLGLAAALFGSFLPARDAARAQPAVALKNVGDAIDPRAVPSPRTAIVLMMIAAVAAFLPAIGNLPLFGYVSIALLLAGGVAAMPWLARTLLAPLQRLDVTHPSIDLALKRLWSAPSQAAIALCGIVASTSLMIAMAVMVSSFRGSVDEWLLQVLPADVYLTIQATGNGFDPETQAALRAAPGVGSVRFVVSTPLRLQADRPPVALLGEDIDKDDPGSTVPLIGSWHRAPHGVTPVWLSEPAARLYGYEIGDRILLPVAGAHRVAASEPAFVSGIWRDYARQHGAIVIGSSDYTRLTGNRLRTNAAIKLAEGKPASDVIPALRAVLPPAIASRVSVSEPSAIRAQSLRIFDRSFAVTYLLEVIAIVVGMAGVAATFSAQTLARTKEFGMLRHIGVMRRQIIAMLAAEGALLGAVGVVAGISLGIAMSQVLIHVVNPQSFNWTMDTRLPLSLFAIVTIALITVAAGTAVQSGRRALSADAVRAVREDW